MSKKGDRILKKLSKRLLSLSSIMVMGLGCMLGIGEPKLPEHLLEQPDK